MPAGSRRRSSHAPPRGRDTTCRSALKWGTGIENGSALAAPPSSRSEVSFRLRHGGHVAFFVVCVLSRDADLKNDFKLFRNMLM